MKKVESVKKNIKNNFGKYIFTNRLFLSYIILSLLGCAIFRNVTISSSYEFVTIASEIGMILLFGSFGYLIKPKNQYNYFFILLIIFTAIEIINSIYYIFYENFASLSYLSSLGQVKTVTDSIFSEIRIIDFIYLIFPIMFYFINKELNKTSYYNYMDKIEKSKPMFVGTLVVSLVCLIFTFSFASKTDFSRLAKQWNRISVVDRFGVILYQSNDIIQTIRPKISSLFGYEDANLLFNEYFNNENNLKYNHENKYTGILEGYNIVYVHMESMQNFLMDLEFNGEEVVPNLNKLSKEGMFFTNFYPQVSTGTSSDAEYIMLTGLLPSSYGPVFVSHPNNKYVTIASLLKEKNYHTFSMHGNLASMWNRSGIHPSLGYEQMIYEESFIFDKTTDVVGLGINDKMFFAQGVQKLEEIESNYQNYFGTVITLSNHSPFKYNEAFDYDISVKYTENGVEKTTCYLCDKTVGDYIISSHYADEALGEFIELIKNSNYFNKTLFVFYGDHDAKLSNKELNYLYNYDYKTGELKDENDKGYIKYDSVSHSLNKKTPLILWTKNSTLKNKLKGKVNNVMGMYDVFPTLLNMLDIDYKYTLGHDIFNIKSDNYVVFPNANYLTNYAYYNNSENILTKLNDKKEIDDIYKITHKEKAELELDVGNAIITYDLHKERNNKGDK